ncbi:UNVERIFIED_CONTAM: hypothetical protein FKN15_017617 [Acipenser sinensis]
MYVLVKWKGGNDTGKLSVIPATWVKNFNEKEFKEDGDEDEKHYVAEWRAGKKEPCGGWAVYDCEVLNMSERPSYLTKIRDQKTTNPEPPVACKRIPQKNRKYEGSSSAGLPDFYSVYRQSLQN